jgi:hypothetical protein
MELPKRGPTGSLGQVHEPRFAAHGEDVRRLDHSVHQPFQPGGPLSLPGRVTLAGCGFALLVSTLGALAASTFGFNYSALSALSYCNYLIVGFAVAWLTSLERAVLSGAIVAATEATLGWALSWVIGPGRPPADQQSAAAVAVAVVFVILLGAVVAGIGGFVGFLFRRRRTPAV